MWGHTLGQWGISHWACSLVHSSPVLVVLSFFASLALCLSLSQSSSDQSDSIGKGCGGRLSTEGKGWSPSLACPASRHHCGVESGGHLELAVLTIVVVMVVIDWWKAMGSRGLLASLPWVGQACSCPAF